MLCLYKERSDNLNRALILLIIVSMFLTGCSKTDLKAVQNNLEQAKNYNSVIKLKIKGEVKKEKLDINKIKNANIDNINGTAKISTISSTNNEVYYIKTGNDKAVTYKKVNNVYESKEVEKDENSLYYITAFINENSEVVQKDNIDDKIIYVLKLKKDRVSSFLKSYLDITPILEDGYSVINDVLVKITVNKNGIIENLNAEFKDVLKCRKTNCEFDKFNINIDYSDFNESKSIKIPNKIIENSIDSKIAKIRQYAFEYIDEVNKLELGSTTFENKLGYTIESTKLTIVDNVVESGLINLQGYTIEIENKQIGIPQK